MKIGILADIHEHVENLRSALDRFQSCRVDQVVILGDVCEVGERIRETVALLRNPNTVGVWGNHDLGLCVGPDTETFGKFGEDVLEFFQTLRPHLEIGGVRFSHGMPTWDATDPGIFYLGDPPWSGESLSSVFTTFPNHAFLIGHYHRWQMWTADRKSDWDGTRPIVLKPQERSFLIVHGVLCGWCAVLDTDTGEFTPYFLL
ncbi:Calcineurin-like phosphoesterase superfamily domain protein [Novipirellula artificiosorum]|uniref:Calcineurin-like phosphoesterase superfamily domain protein n=2 Tax=Novipirellula artificiosorum TaxID=2528016 RepID=A0A5C6DN92_9BACT|nr:Calcineurin-like phosphoesterase superfamily domain protein [Novipirellula artificiosorum]